MKPLSGLVRHEGNECLFNAIEMSIVSGLDGVPLHVHVEGLRGTGKTTIMRSARAVLPTIVRIKGCLYNCDPLAPHCPEHAHLSESEIASIGVEEIPVPFLEISHSAKVGTVVGSIDLKKLTDRSNPSACILPGTIPQAHRGVIFVDEINRLAETSPELADILLGVMGTKPGRVQIEETGLPLVELPVRVSVWAASNPDEEPGPLEDVRRQLADRFDLVAGVSRPTSPHIVKTIIAGKPSSGSPMRSSSEVKRRAGLVPSVTVPGCVQDIIAGLYVDFALESLRAVEALEQGSRVAAALHLRNEVELDDLIGVVPLVLRHRVSVSTMAQILKYLTERSAAEPSKLRPSSPNRDDGKMSADRLDSAAASQQQGSQGTVERLFARLRESIAGGSGQAGAGTAADGGSSSKSSHGGRGATQNLGGSNSGSGAGSWANPMDVPVFAPRNRATPIAGLPAGELLKNADDLRQ